MHFHRDPDFQLVGCWLYYECKCGARRVRRAYYNLMGPSKPGWPLTRNKHGQPVDDTGWVFSEDFTGGPRDKYNNPDAPVPVPEHLFDGLRDTLLPPYTRDGGWPAVDPYERDQR